MTLRLREFTLTLIDEATDVETEDVDVSTEDREVETDDEEVGMDDEEAGTSSEVGTGAGGVCTDDEDVGTDSGEVGIDDEDVGTDSGKVGTGDEEVPTDDEEVSAGTVGMEVDASGGTALEFPVVTELLDTVGVVERVQFFTSCTSLPCGIRIMTQVSVTTPVGLEKEKLVKTPIPGGPDIRINNLNTGDSGGLGSGGLGSGKLRGWDSGGLKRLSSGKLSRSDTRSLIMLLCSSE